MQFREAEILEAIRAQFAVETNMRFLHPQWKKRRKEGAISSTGFCYLATHAYFELMGGIASQLVVKKWADTSNSIDGHFWVEKQTGEIVDLTKDQYPTGFKHYSEGIISKKGPSKKANNFTQIVRESLKRKAQN